MSSDRHSGTSLPEREQKTRPRSDGRALISRALIGRDVIGRLLAELDGLQPAVAFDLRFDGKLQLRREPSEFGGLQ